MSRGNLAKLCAALESFAVLVKPEEIAAPTRQIFQRVLGDFAVSAFTICHDAVNQPLACNIANHNSSSALSSGTANRVLLIRLAFQLLSKGSTQYSLIDAIQPDPKKFEKMIQQMVNYLYHSEKVYDLVDQTCSELDDKAAQIKQELEAFESEKNELSVVLHRVKKLETDAVPDKIAESMKRHEKVTEESRVLGERYNELKERVKAITDEVEQLTSLLKQRQNDLASVQALVVEDPDRCIGELQRLRESIASQKEQLNAKSCAHSEALQQLQLVQDALERSKALHKKAVLAASATEELAQVEKDLENRTALQGKILLELDSHLGELKTSVEDRKKRLEKVKQEDYEAQSSLEALEEAEVGLKCKREEVEARRRNLANEVTVEAAHIASVLREIERTREIALRQLSQGHSEQMRIWKTHVKEMDDFSEACKTADEQLEPRHAQLTVLSEALQKFALKNSAHNDKEKKKLKK